jgi:hypothetical protein
MLSSKDEFASEAAEKSFQDWLFPRLPREPSLVAIVLFGDFTQEIDRGTPQWAFLGHPVTAHFDTAVQLDRSALEDPRVVRALKWAGTIGNFWVLYEVEASCDFLREVEDVWIEREQLPNELARRRPELTPDMTQADRDGLTRLVSRLPMDHVYVSFGAEGLVMRTLESS